MKKLIVVLKIDDRRFEIDYHYSSSYTIPNHKYLYAFNPASGADGIDLEEYKAVIPALFGDGNNLEIWYTLNDKQCLDTLYFAVQRFSSPGLYERFYKSFSAYLASGMPTKTNYRKAREANVFINVQ